MKDTFQGLWIMRNAFRTPLILIIILHACAAHGAADVTRGSIVQDSLAFSDEVRVITKEELRDYNIHTLEDILELLHDISFWREGPPGSRTGYSLDGRSDIGVTLLVNGEPFYDPYNFEALSRFLQISRLERIEIIYSGSPSLVGDLSANGAINFVIEEGGRAGPMTSLDFTFGSRNKRARRAWFSTPEAHVSATIVYDEYLTDASPALTNDQSRKIGDYNSRTVLMDLLFSSDSGGEILVRLQRYEDTYVGTRLPSTEDIRYDGFTSLIRYRRGGFSASLNQRDVRVSRDPAIHAGLVIGGSAHWSGKLGNLGTRIFATGKHSAFENMVEGASFDPEYHRIEGGIAVFGEAPLGLGWKGGIFAGDHSVVGGYMSGEFGLTRRGAVSPSLSIARKLRVPSAQELFLPPTDLSWPGIETIVTGNTDLGPEITDEVTLATSFYNSLWVDLFARREKSRIILTGSSDSLVYRSEGEGEVAGGKARFVYGAEYLGFGYNFDLGFELFGKRSEWTPGIPRYRFAGRFRLRRRVFRESEVVTFRWDSEASGERQWYDVELGAYSVHNITLSMTLMGAVLKFQLRNVFDTKYETVPGFLMSERHWVIGIFWELFD